MLKMLVLQVIKIIALFLSFKKMAFVVFCPRISQVLCGGQAKSDLSILIKRQDSTHHLASAVLTECLESIKVSRYAKQALVFIRIEKSNLRFILEAQIDTFFKNS